MPLIRTLGATVALMVSVVSLAHAQATDPEALPAGVTTAMIQAGEKIYQGPGMCSVCHGIDGKGGVGANLVDSTWLHSKGGYDEIIRQITIGVSAKESTTGVPMPPKGGSSINETQVKAVAAYVWSRSHPGAR